MLNGLGKTGFKKIDFEENKILDQFKEADLFKRLDQSIKRHVDWNNGSTSRKTQMNSALRLGFSVTFAIILSLILYFN